MKAIIISETSFEMAFDNCKKALELEKFNIDQPYLNLHDAHEAIINIHRKYHYYLMKLKEEIRMA